MCLTINKNESEEKVIRQLIMQPITNLEANRTRSAGKNCRLMTLTMSPTTTFCHLISFQSWSLKTANNMFTLSLSTVNNVFTWSLRAINNVFARSLKTVNNLFTLSLRTVKNVFTRSLKTVNNVFTWFHRTVNNVFTWVS